MTTEERIDNLEKQVEDLKRQLDRKQDKEYNVDCNHQTIPFGQHKRKCGKCGKIFIVD
jgi:hypothetical protein